MTTPSMIAGRPPIRLTRGVPAVESFPIAQLSECAQVALAEHGPAVLQYGPARGFQPLRGLIAAEYGVSDTAVLLGHGSLLLQDFCARALLGPGKLAYVEEPSYDRAITVLRSVGAQVVGIPLQSDGPDVELLERRLRQGERPTLFYMIPDFQNPSGTLLSLAKRQRIVALAAEYDFWIIEDAPYRKLRYRGADLPTLFELSPERVFAMSSYSKLISPGLRVGYVVIPEPHVGQLVQMAEATYINASYLNQAIVYQFIQKGWLEPNIASLKALYAPRLDAMLAALDEQMADLASLVRPDCGFFIGMTLDKPIAAEALLAAARNAGLELTDGRGFFANGGGDAFVRLPFCALTPAEIHEGVRRLAGVIRELQYPVDHNAQAGSVIRRVMDPLGA